MALIHPAAPPNRIEYRRIVDAIWRTAKRFGTRGAALERPSRKC
jgi:hypothetical protein